MPLVWKIIHSYLKKQVENVSQHFDGSSITDTKAWDMVLSKNKTLKNKKKYPEFAILETAQAGACWPVTRVADVMHEASVCELCWQYTIGCFHSVWKCPALRNTEDEAIIESQHLIEELDVNRIAFYNRALVQEKELKLDEQYNPLDEYDLQVRWNKLAPSPETPEPPARLYEPRGTRTMGSPHPDEGQPKPVLYIAPDWVQDCGFDELLNQAGYTTERRQTNTDTETPNEPGTSSLDAPDINIFETTVEQDIDIEENGRDHLPPEEPTTEPHNLPHRIEGVYSDGWRSGYYFGDGSGGKYSKYPSITRCGVGVHYVNPNKQPVFDASMPLPGEIQSNSMAEIYAILTTVRLLEIAGKIYFFTDNKPAINTYNKGKDRARLACHADLWAEVFDHIERKHIDLNVYWIPSHTDKHKDELEKAPAWMKEWHVKGNNVADNLAGKAAELHAVPEEQANKIIKYTKI